ncbi:MAG TPA: rod shape-determining protein [Nitrospinaceae bacterium]|jgi:rod shape-determining protein MreB|nr:rod shape-determining protein [Nitrospinaceae bacterium]
MIFENLIGNFSTDIAMDLGTANTLVYIKDEGVVLNEPSIVAVSDNGEKVEAVGNEAKQMFGRTPGNLQTIRPMKDGVIADFNVTNRMITYFIKKVIKKNWFIKPRIMIGVPTCITQVEKKAVIEAALMSGVREVHLIEEPMAAAIGANIPVHKPEGNMVIDIGGGTSDVAIISLSTIAYGESVRLAGDAIDESIVRYLRLQHNLNIGIFEGERIKLEIGSAYPELETLSTEVKGINVQTGVPTSITISENEIREAIQEPILTIISTVMKALEKIPPELSADIHSNGIYLTGGGALIRGLDKLIEEQTTLKVYKPDEPLLGIVKGVGTVLNSYEKMKDVCIC